MAEWHDTMLTDSAGPLTLELEPGKQTPVTEIPFVKEAPDFKTFMKSAIDAHREVGARVRIPGKDAKPEDLAAFRGKLMESGVIPSPIKDIKEYGLVKPEKLPDGVGWDDKLAESFGGVLMKHGISKDAAKDLLDLYGNSLLGVQASLKGSEEEATAALKKEFGAEYETRAAEAERLTKMIFKSEDELAFFDATGIGNHPLFLSVMMRLAPLAAQDSTYLREMGRETGGRMTGDEVKAEVAKIMQDKSHPDHAGYWRNDPVVIAKIDKMYKDAYGDAKVTF